MVTAHRYRPPHGKDVVRIELSPDEASALARFIRGDRDAAAVNVSWTVERKVGNVPNGEGVRADEDQSCGCCCEPCQDRSHLSCQRQSPCSLYPKARDDFNDASRAAFAQDNKP